MYRGMLPLPDLSSTGLQNRSALVQILGEALKIPPHLDEKAEDGHDDTRRPNSLYMALLLGGRHPPATGNRAIEPPSDYCMHCAQSGTGFC